MKSKTNTNVAFTPTTKCRLGVAFVLLFLAATLADAQLTLIDNVLSTTGDCP